MLVRSVFQGNDQKRSPGPSVGIKLFDMGDNLSTYRAKRDFKKTEEPSGGVSVKSSNRRRFLIQKHDATRLHHDLLLELDGVFKSWAVTRGPSLDPQDGRLAVDRPPSRAG